MDLDDGGFFAINPARPPVAMTFVSGPNSVRKRATMPSVMQHNHRAIRIAAHEWCCVLSPKVVSADQRAATWRMGKERLGCQVDASRNGPPR